MILIVGGKASGKYEYAKTLGFFESDFSDGILENDKCCVNHLEQLVAASPEDAMDKLPLLLTKKIVICDEIGCGIVPMDRQQRVIREETGRLCIELAKQASAVVRMVCGIPTVIKGEL